MILLHDSFSIFKTLFLSFHLIFYFTKLFTPFPQRKTGSRMGKWHLRAEKHLCLSMTVSDLLMINRTVKNFPEPCQSGMMGSAVSIIA
jgi:hypothetical protein